MGTTINPATAVKRNDGITALSVVITGLTNGTTYYVWIKAKNDTGTSGFSPTASGRPSVFTVTPQVPAAPSVSIGSGQITVTWTAVEGAMAYEVWFGTLNNSSSAAKNGGDVTTSLSSIISGLTNGTTYYIWIKAKNNIGTSGFSSAASGKPIGTPGLPTVSSAGYMQLLVTWTAVIGADEYEVYYGIGTPTTLATTTSETTAVITVLTDGTTFYVRLRAKNSTGVSDYGPSASGIPSDERSPGLYRGNEKIGHQNLNAALSYISANAVSGDNYYIVLGEDESAPPTSLNYSGKTVGIALLGYSGERTITLASNGSMFTVNTGVTLTLDENISLIGINTNNASLVRVNSNGTFIMNDGTISGNSSSGINGGGIYVASNGTLTMNDGTISGNRGELGGGGIHVASNGTLTMNGGTISGNSNYNNGGGGIHVASSGTFTMNDGIISENYGHMGGGIYMTGGTITMNGGTISGNNSGLGSGGINVASNGTLTMNGGTISGNKGGRGGGINVAGTLTIYGGIISSNTGVSTSTNVGGIYVTSNGTLIMYGGIISGSNIGSIYVGHGISVDGGTFKKLPSGNGQNSGIIYGSEETGVGVDGMDLRNTGDAVFISSEMRRSTTAGQTDYIDSTTGRGLSANGEPPYGQ